MPNLVCERIKTVSTDNKHQRRWNQVGLATSPKLVWFDLTWRVPCVTYLINKERGFMVCVVNLVNCPPPLLTTTNINH